MAKFTRSAHFIFIAFIILFLIAIYKDVFIFDKVPLATNYLAHFFSPWSTTKLPGWEHGIPNKPLGTDLLRFFYPQHESGLSFWNPYIFSGNPVMANFQSAIFYPLTHLPWILQIISPPFLATVFCLLFLRSLKLPLHSQILGSFAYGFSGFIITWSQEAIAVAQTAVWLPLIFYSIETRKKILLVFALTMSIFAGYLQICFYIFALSTFYATYKKMLRAYLLCVLTSLLIGSVQLIPSLIAFQNSPRPIVKIDLVFDKYLLPLWHLIKTVAPDINGHPGSYNYFASGSYNETALFIGTIPLIFAILGFTRSRFFTFAGIATFLLTANLPGIKNLLTLPFLPLIPTFQPSRILILTTFCLSVLAAYGFEKFNFKYLRNVTLFCLAALAVSIIYYKFILSLPRDFIVVIKNCIIPSIFIFFILISSFLNNKKLVIILALTLTIIGQYLFFNKYLALGEKEFLYPNHQTFEYFKKNDNDLSRSLAFGAPIMGNIPSIKRYYSPEGFDAIFSKRYGQLVHYAKTGELTDNISRIEVTLSELKTNDLGQIVENWDTNPNRLKLLNLIGVKNIAFYNASASAWLFSQNTQAFPRTYLVNSYIVKTNHKEILDTMFDFNTNLRNTVILEQSLTGFNPVIGAPGSAIVTTYQPDKIEIITQSINDKILFLSDNFFPGWQATIDNHVTKIYQANFSFRAIMVPAGKHFVRFTYNPYAF